jgi:peptide chain release factor 1
MFDLEKAKSDCSALNQRLAEDQSLDNRERAKLQKEAFFLAKCIEKGEEIFALKNQQEECNALLQGADLEMISLVELEKKELSDEVDKVELELQEMLYPPDPRNSRSAFLEIRPAAGGQESSIFVDDLFKMYSAYIASRGWKITINSMISTEAGGFREIIACVSGKGVFGELRYESGVHRVQRVPVTETAGRVHTSTATVVVIPEAKEVDFNISPSDIRIDVYRSSGAGGQSVNTTDSAVRLTYIPTGIIVTCQDERSQIKNRAKAMKELRSRLLAAEADKAEKAASDERKSKMGSGDRSEKIRTYNYPQNRITDHRIGLTLKKLDIIMQGELAEIITALKKEASSQDQK